MSSQRQSRRETEQMLLRYQAAARVRRELADIMGDDDMLADAAAAEADSELAIKLVRAEIW